MLVRAATRMPKPDPSILMITSGHLDYAPVVVTVPNFLAQQGFKLTVLTLGGDDRRPAILSNEIEFLNIPYPDSPRILVKGLCRLSTAARLRSAFCGSRFDILYVIHSWTLPAVWLAGGGSYRALARRFVYHTFDWIEPRPETRFHRWYERAACRSASLVVHHEHVAGRLRQALYGVTRAPLWIPNYLSKAVAMAPREQSLRQRLVGQEAPADAVLMVYPCIGRASMLTRELIQAFRHLPARYRLATVAGSGSYQEACLEEVRVSDLSDRITWVDPMPDHELRRYVACADIGATLADARQSSGFFMYAPSKLSSFVANGIPFVAPDFPSIEAVVYRYGLGLCCDPYDPADIARAIRQLVEEPPGLEERRRHVRAMFEEHLNFEVHGHRLVAALHELLKEPGTLSGGLEDDARL
jgi:glycosyltransferase involved in cell wall biosynthesis